MVGLRDIDVTRLQLEEDPARLAYEGTIDASIDTYIISTVAQQAFVGPNLTPNQTFALQRKTDGSPTSFGQSLNLWEYPTVLWRVQCVATQTFL